MLSKELNQQDIPIFELHTWEKLLPFFNIACMIDVMTFFIKLMLIATVLISIMNVMIMAVYERIREIGTIAAIGTLQGNILNMLGGVLPWCCRRRRSQKQRNRPSK